MPDRAQAPATLEHAYRSAFLSRRAFVSGLAAATAAASFGSSVRVAHAAAEHQADHLDRLAAARYGGTLKVALTGQPDQLDPATSSIYTAAQQAIGAGGPGDRRRGRGGDPG